MDIEKVRHDDASAVEQIVALGEAIVKVDSPWAHPATPTSLAAMLRDGWDGEAPEQYVGRLGGQVIGSARVWASNYDNLDAAWFDVGVHPEQRRRGLGAQLLALLNERSVALGRTSVGISGWESVAARGFAEGAGFAFGQSEIARRLDVEDVPDGFAALVDDAQHEHAGDYEFLTLSGPLPQELWESVAVLQAAINDAPWDDIEMEPEVFPVERILAYERAQLAGGKRPHLADQHDTSVLGPHRGHRLGLVLKGLALEYLRSIEPQVRTYDTWNAESNQHMIAVNDAMGFRIMGRALAFQKK